MGVTAEARRHIKLVMLVNDVSLRNLIPAELAKGFGFFQSKPWTAFSPVAVTPDELGDAWNGGSIDLPLVTTLNGKRSGGPTRGRDMVFDFAQLIAHAAKTRAAGRGHDHRFGHGRQRGAGEGPGEPISEGGRGYTFIAEQRMIETILDGAPKTPFLKFGDTVRVEMLDKSGANLFGTIDQDVKRYSR